jgi:hypothetical protein
MKNFADFVKSLDHPIVFLLFLWMALQGFSALVTWLAKAANMQGLAVMAQHP